MALKPVKLDAQQNSAANPASQGGRVDTPPQQADASAPAAPAKADIRKKLFPVIGAVAALAVVGLGINWFINGRFEVKTDNAYVRADITNVAAKVQGYVDEVHVKSNQPVKAGDLLITMESADYEARVAEAKAALAQAEADAAQSKARIAAQNGRVGEARASATAAGAQADLSKSDTERFTELAEKGWYPKARLEQVEATERTAAAKRDAANATVRQAQQELTASVSSATSAEAKVEAAKARLASTELDLGRTQIRAPIDGVIANNNLVKGMLLSPGQIGMAIVPAGDAYVVANFKETQVEKMAPGQRVRIEVDAYPDLHVEGTIDSLAPATGATFSLIPQDTATGNFTKIVQRVPVKILLDKEALATGLLRAGLAVEATVITKPATTPKS